METVKSFAGWLGKNSKLKGSELQDAAQKAGYGAADVALAPFPQVVQMMAQKPDWTKALGQAFTADKDGIFDSIQRLRAQAQAVGNLKTTSQQQVETKTTAEGQQVIVIQPANPQVIYVPTYNPTDCLCRRAAAAPQRRVGRRGGRHRLHRGGDHRRLAQLLTITPTTTTGTIAKISTRIARITTRTARTNYQQNQDQRQSNAQANQDQRQSSAQANQDQRQSSAQAQPGPAPVQRPGESQSQRQRCQFRAA